MQPYEIEPIDIDITNDEILVFNMKAYQASDSEGYYAHRPQENHRYRYSRNVQITYGAGLSRDG